MDDPLRNPLSVEVGELLDKDVILEQERPPRPRAEAVQFVPHRGPVRRGEPIWVLNKIILFQNSFSLSAVFQESSWWAIRLGLFFKCGFYLPGEIFLGGSEHNNL